MARWVEKSKPAAEARVHLMLAWVMWGMVGAVLVGFGGRWLWQSPTPSTPWLTGLAMAIGVFKARFVLDRAARKIVDRIRERGDGRCLGGFLSLRSWAFVAAMAGGGRILRCSHIARGLLGVLYIAVGTALLLSSRVALRAWRDSRQESTS